jgi:hypothetical protein
MRFTPKYILESLKKHLKTQNVPVNFAVGFNKNCIYLRLKICTNCLYSPANDVMQAKSFSSVSRALFTEV